MAHSQILNLKEEQIKYKFSPVIRIVNHEVNIIAQRQQKP